MSTTQCSHLDRVRDVAPRTPQGCEECLKTDGEWVRLRLCLTCGHVGCCDQSPQRHATQHFHETGHPLMRSFERGEDWGWCYVDELLLEPAPGGKGRRRRRTWLHGRGTASTVALNGGRMIPSPPIGGAPAFKRRNS